MILRLRYTPSCRALAVEHDEVPVISNESLRDKIDAEVRDLRTDMMTLRAEVNEVYAYIAERKAMRKVILYLFGGAGTGVAIFGIAEAFAT